MKTFGDYIRYIINNFEGGFVDDPDDRGGTTKYGISLSFLKYHHLDLTGDGIANEEDIKSLKKADAIEIYRVYFWEKIKGEELNKIDHWIALFVLDTHINTGMGGAILQRAINDFYKKRVLRVDNLIGTKTLSALRQANLQMVRLYLLKHRELYYVNITKNRPKNIKYLMGWSNRVFKFIDLINKM